jgi:hypothetical protein
MPSPTFFLHKTGGRRFTRRDDGLAELVPCRGTIEADVSHPHYLSMGDRTGSRQRILLVYERQRRVLDLDGWGLARAGARVPSTPDGGGSAIGQRGHDSVTMGYSGERKKGDVADLCTTYRRASATT